MQPWKTIATGGSDSYRIFEVRRETAVSPRSGIEHEFVVINSPDWINVIPLTERDEVVFVHQYRQGTRDVTLEIPGGMIDGGESPEAAGARELLEETGFAGERCVLIGSVHPNPAIQRNTCHTVLVERAVRVAEPAPDPSEELDVVLVPLARIPEMIRSRRISHALVIAAFHHLALHRLPPPPRGAGNRA